MVSLYFRNSLFSGHDVVAPMPVQFICPHCQKLLSVGSRKVGCQVNCPKCASEVLVPAAEEAAAAVAMARAARERLSVLEVPITELIVDETPESSGDYLPLVAAAALESGSHTGCAVTGYETQAAPIANSVPTGNGSRRESAATAVATPVVAVARPGPAIVSAAVGALEIATAVAVEPPPLPAFFALPSLETPSLATPRAALPPLRSPVQRDMIMISRITLYVQAVLLCLVAFIAFSIGYTVGRGSPPEPAVREASTDPVVLDGK